MARLITWIICVWLVGASIAGAQGPDTPDDPGVSQPGQPPTANGTSSPVVEKSLEIYYVRDEKDKLVPVVGFTLKRFQELYDLKQELEGRDQKPRYSLQNITATGTVTGAVGATDHAELTIGFQVVVRDEGPVRIPLHLDRAVLRESIKFQGPGELFLHFDEQEEKSDGYVVWLSGGAEKSRQITLRVLVPLETVGSRRRLRLRVPRATTSKLELTVPVAGAVGTVSDGAAMASVEQVNGSKSRFSVVGLGGDFQLTWHQAGTPVADVPSVLEASALVTAKIDGRAVHTDAALTVRSYAGAIKPFLVRLPPEAEWIPTNPTGYTIVPVKPQNGEPSAVEVRFLEDTSGPETIRLSTKQTRPSSGEEAWFDLSGFEVMGAAGQSGYVAVVTDEAWGVYWGDRQGIHQVDQLPESLQQENVVARFQYVSQPYQLLARATRRTTKTSVEPEYLCVVSADRVELRARLKYEVRGAPAYLLHVDLQGWEIDQVGPEAVVVAADINVSSAGVLAIPLQRASTGSVEVELRAYREISPGTERLSLPLLKPQADSTRPATLVVVADDNVELTPDIEASVDLTRQQVAPPMELPPRQQKPLFYRGEGTDETAFVADFRTLSRSIRVEASGRIDLARERSRVAQTFVYTIQHEPADRLTLLVPPELAAEGQLTVTQGEETLSTEVVSAPPAAENGDGPVHWRVRLGEPRIGTCELVVRYECSGADPTAEKETLQTIPLVVPGEGELVGNELLVVSEAPIRVRPRDGKWIQDKNGHNGLLHTGMRLTAAEPVPHAAFWIRVDARAASRSTVVRRAWIQTWLTHSDRQDRAVFNFSTSREEIELTMPEGVSPGQLDALLDGAPVLLQGPGDDRLRVPIPAGSNHREHVLDLRYRFEQRPPRGGVEFAFPRLGDNHWVQRWYWQLLLPQDEHLVSSPAGLTSERQWTLHGWGWQRTPLLEQGDLEAWVGVEPSRVDSGGTNRYLFSGMTPRQECRVRTAGRSLVVLIASGVVLLVGLILIHVRAMRRPQCLVVAAAALVAGVIWWPDASRLLAQAASLGLVLTLLAMVLERKFVRRRVAWDRRDSAVLETDSTQTEYRPSRVGSPSSTETAPAPATGEVSPSDIP